MFLGVCDPIVGHTMTAGGNSKRRFLTRFEPSPFADTLSVEKTSWFSFLTLDNSLIEFLVDLSFVDEYLVN